MNLPLHTFISGNIIMIRDKLSTVLAVAVIDKSREADEIVCAVNDLAVVTEQAQLEKTLLDEENDSLKRLLIKLQAKLNEYRAKEIVSVQTGDLINELDEITSTEAQNL